MMPRRYALTFRRRYGRIFPTIGALPDIAGPSVKSVRTERYVMERIKTLETRSLCQSAKNGGCGECQTSCQSACKTSCGVANQKCENEQK